MNITGSAASTPLTPALPFDENREGFTLADES
jgi:3-oxoacyl-(acyl-carrier-protein) synthase